jgi:hypothetical protein
LGTPDADNVGNLGKDAEELGADAQVSKVFPNQVCQDKALVDEVFHTLVDAVEPVCLGTVSLVVVDLVCLDTVSPADVVVEVVFLALGAVQVDAVLPALVSRVEGLADLVEASVVRALVLAREDEVSQVQGEVPVVPVLLALVAELVERVSLALGVALVAQVLQVRDAALEAQVSRVQVLEQVVLGARAPVSVQVAARVVPVAALAVRAVPELANHRHLLHHRNAEDSP